MSSRLDALRRQFDDVRTGIDTIETTVATRGDDITDDEQSSLDQLFTRAGELTPEIETIAKREESLNATANVLAKVGAARPAPIQRAITSADTKSMTAGEYLSAYMRSQEGDTDAGLLLRAVADQLTTDVSALLPKAIAGDLISFADANRPVFNSFTSRPMPEKGKTFTRPRLTQRVLIAEQATEKTQLASRKMTVGGEDVSKATFGGVLDISQQAIDWTDPALLDLVLSDFADMYAEIAEQEAVDFLVAKATGTSLWTGTNVGSIVTSFTTGVTAVYGTAKRMPDTIWLSLDAAMGLAGTTNSDNSVTAISMIKQALSDVGINLNFVVGPLLPADTRIVGNAGLVESYEKRNGLVQAVNVPLLGWDVGYSAYLAFYGRAEGFASMEAA